MRWPPLFKTSPQEKTLRTKIYSDWRNYSSLKFWENRRWNWKWIASSSDISLSDSIFFVCLTVNQCLWCTDQHYHKISIIAPPQLSDDLSNFWSTLLWPITAFLHFTYPVAASLLWLTNHILTKSWRPLLLQSCISVSMVKPLVIWRSHFFNEKNTHSTFRLIQH